MKFSVSNNALLPAVSTLCNIIERRQTLTSLSMILIEAAPSGGCVLTATDHLIEIRWFVSDVSLEENSPVLVSGQKLLDACRNSPKDARVSLSNNQQNVMLQIEKQNYLLNTISADEFPKQKSAEDAMEVVVKSGDMKYLIEKISHAMAQNDSRYYLNGALLSVDQEEVTVVATDGHRLALCQLPKAIAGNDSNRQVILPRKVVLELQKLLDSKDDDSAKIKISERQICVTYKNITITAQLIEAEYPDYQRVIPQKFTETVLIDTAIFRRTLEAACVIREDRTSNVRLDFSKHRLLAVTQNKEGEKAEVEQEINYEGTEFQIAFNAQYLLDVLTVTESEKFYFEYRDSNSGAQIREENTDATKNIIMPTQV